MQLNKKLLLKLTSGIIALLLVIQPMSFSFTAHAEKSSLEYLNELNTDEDKFKEIQSAINNKIIELESAELISDKFKEAQNSPLLESQKDLEADKSQAQRDQQKIENLKEEVKQALLNSKQQNQESLLIEIQTILDKEELTLKATTELLRKIDEEIAKLDSPTATKKKGGKKKANYLISDFVDVSSKEGKIKFIANKDDNRIERILTNGEGVNTTNKITEENIRQLLPEILQEQLDLLGIDANELIQLQVSDYEVRNGSFIAQVNQLYNGIKVESEPTIVVINKDGNIISIKNNIHEIQLSTKPNLKKKESITKAKKAVFWNEKTDVIKTTELVIFKNTLAYKVTLTTINPMGEWVMYINANNGEVIDYYNEISFVDEPPAHHINVSGRILSNSAASDIEVKPFTNLQLKVGDESYYTDENGSVEVPFYSYALANLSTSTYEVRTDTPPSAQVKISPDRDVNKIIWDQSNSSIDQTNVFYHLGEAEKYFRNLGAAIKEKKLIATVNSALVEAYLRGCGAWYNAEQHTIELGKGGCGNINLAYSRDTIIHEFVHSIIYNIYYLKNVPNSESGSMNEGLADYFTASMTDDPIFGEKSLAFVRNLDNTLTVEKDWQGIIHHDSQIFSGALWDIRSELGQEVTDKLILDTLHYYPTNFEDFLHSMILADDNDEDPSNGSPNMVAILDSFSKHGIGPGVDGYEGTEDKMVTIAPTETCEGAECLMFIATNVNGISITKIEVTGAATVAMTIRNDSGGPYVFTGADDFGGLLTGDGSVLGQAAIPAGALAAGATVVVSIATTGSLPSLFGAYVCRDFALAPAGRTAADCGVIGNVPVSIAQVAGIGINIAAIEIPILLSPSASHIVGDIYELNTANIDAATYPYAFNDGGVSPAMPTVFVSSNIPSGPITIEGDEASYKVTVDKPNRLAGDVSVTAARLLTGDVVAAWSAAIVGTDAAQIAGFNGFAGVDNPITTSSSGAIATATPTTTLTPGTYTWGMILQNIRTASIMYVLVAFTAEEPGGLNPIYQESFQEYLQDLNQQGLEEQILLENQEQGVVTTAPAPGTEFIPQPAGGGLADSGGGPGQGSPGGGVPGGGPGQPVGNPPIQGPPIIGDPPIETPGCPPPIQCIPPGGVSPFQVFVGGAAIGILTAPKIVCSQDCKFSGGGTATSFYEEGSIQMTSSIEHGDAPEKVPLPGDPFNYAIHGYFPSILDETLHPRYSAHLANSGLFIGHFSKQQGVSYAEVDGRIPDLDDFEDATIPSNLPTCSAQSIKLPLTVPEDNTQNVYINAWADHNQDSSWDGSSTCFSNGAPIEINEHFIVNNELISPEGGEYTINLPFHTGPLDGNTWIRLEVANDPTIHTDGSGVYHTGETEDHIVYIGKRKGAIFLCGNGVLDASETCEEIGGSITYAPGYGGECSSCQAYNVQAVCASGTTLDRQGRVFDCTHPTCSPLVQCSIEICSDGKDNDNDGKTDCSDEQCSDSTACQEICWDTIDNDGNGLTDCQDPKCSLSGSCSAIDSIGDSSRTIIFTKPPSIAGVGFGGIGVGSGDRHGAAMELEEISSALLARGIVLSPSDINRIPVPSIGLDRNISLIDKWVNFFFENLLEIILFIIFTVFLFMDLQRLMPNIRKLFTRKRSL